MYRPHMKCPNCGHKSTDIVETISGRPIEICSECSTRFSEFVPDLEASVIGTPDEWERPEAAALRALREVQEERQRQDAKWGEQNHDDYRWLAILTEEVGELAQAMLHSQFGGEHAGTERTELVQVAAVAVQWLECMGRRETAAPATACRWVDQDDYWQTDCGELWTLIADGPTENGMNYCPKCGRPLVVETAEEVSA